LMLSRVAYFAEFGALPALVAGAVYWKHSTKPATPPAPQRPGAAFNRKFFKPSSRPCSWEEVRAYAAAQEAQLAAGLGPRRAPETDAVYELYKRWCDAHSAELRNEKCAGFSTNALYVLRYTAWEKEKAGAVGVALEPNIVPYTLDAGISHWVLWHHPTLSAAHGDAELEVRSERRIVAALLEAAALESDEEQLIAFQNVPALRSIPELAHAHVFLRPDLATEEGLALAARLERRGEAHAAHSPWLRSSDSDSAA